MSIDNTEIDMTKPNKGLRAAVDQKCRDCIYDELSPGRWRQQVAGCEITDCPLWPVRCKSTGKEA